MTIEENYDVEIAKNRKNRRAASLRHRSQENCMALDGEPQSDQLDWVM